MQKLKPYPHDCDEVYDLGEASRDYLDEAREDYKHILLNSHRGWVDVICPKTGHRYHHVIMCPNKNTLLCRGCGAELS